MNYSNEFVARWARERRVCSESHFDTYFRFALSTEILSKAELENLIAKASDPYFIANQLRESIAVKRPTGGTKAAVILTELTYHADRIKKVDVQPLLTGLFMVADEIDVSDDSARGFNIANNRLRLHWLLRSLTLDRFSLEDRSTIFLEACHSASLGWLADFSDSAWGDYHPREGGPSPLDQCLTTMADAQILRDMLHKRIEQSSKNGALLESNHLAFLLYRWRDLDSEDCSKVRAWTSEQVATDLGLRKLAHAFTSYTWSQSLGFSGLGDVAARRSTRASVKGLEQLLDIVEFRRRVEDVAARGEFPEVNEFLAAWHRQEQDRPH